MILSEISQRRAQNFTIFKTNRPSGLEKRFFFSESDENGNISRGKFSQQKRLECFRFREKMSKLH